MGNVFAILVCALLSVVLGTLWYSPLLFGNIWMKELGITPEAAEAARKKGMSAMWKSYVLQIVASFVTAFVLGMQISYNGLTSVPTAMTYAFFVWFGFYATSSIGSVTWEGRRWRYWALNNGFNLVLLLAMSAILVSWK